MSQLSIKQSAVVNAPLTTAIQVLASAGSGKTRVLTERVRYILASSKREGVIALTFTNKAADEMLSRLDDISDLQDRCWIATIHSVAQRILEQYGHTIGLPSDLHIYEREQDRKTLFLQSLRESGVDVDTFLNVGDDHAKKERDQGIQKLLTEFSVIKRELMTDEEIVQRYSDGESLLSTYRNYQAALLQSGGIDFDDILMYAHRILLEQPWCAEIYRAKYRHICVDEAQDLNRAQYEFVKALCGDSIRSLMMVGDPNQMIYGFNGSSSDYFCNLFVADFQPINFELKENYRSSKAVIRLANKLKSGSQIESDFVLDGVCEICAFDDERAEADWVAKKISELLTLAHHPEIEGDINLSKMVVIARNRFVFLELEKVFNEKNIPYSLKKGERKVEPSSQFGKVLDLGIRIKLNPKDWVDGNKLCSVLGLEKYSQWDDDNVLLDISKKVMAGEALFAKTLSDLLNAIWEIDVDTPNISKFYDQFKSHLELLKLILPASEEGELERSLFELDDFMKCWIDFRRRGLGDSLSAFKNAVALGRIYDEPDTGGITLSTVHTMKGLERDIVFIVGMCEGVFPDYRAIKPKEIEEELNSIFVAVTRAKRWVYLTYPKQRMMPWGSAKWQEPSRYIKLLNL